MSTTAQLMREWNKHLEDGTNMSLNEAVSAFTVIPEGGAIKDIKKGVKAGEQASKSLDSATETKEMKVKDKEGFVVDTESKQNVGSLAQTPKSKVLVKKMYDMVSKKLKLKSIEDVQPIKDGIAFIFGDPSDAKKMASHLKKAGSLGKVMKLAAGGGKRTLVSLKT